jgi:glycosyltransferase involved in cell wall biosynthesis
VITSAPAPVPDDAEVTVHRPPWRNDRIGTVRYGHTPAGVSRIVAGQFDVVHVHLSVLSPLALGALRRCARRGIPVVTTVHSIWNRGTGVLATGLGSPAQLTGSANSRIAWSAVSTIAAEAVERQLGTPVHVVPNGIDAAEWRPVEMPVGEHQLGAPLRLLTTMRLARRKRPIPLVELVADARDRLSTGGVGLELTVIGDGPLRSAVETRAERRGLPVRLTGRLDRAGIRALMGGHDLYVAPARLESFGIAALEARCAGLPVLAQAASGVSDFITDGVDGFLTATDAEMSARIVDLARRPARLAALAERARSVVPGIDWSTTLDGYDELYARVTASTVRTSTP